MTWSTSGIKMQRIHSFDFCWYQGKEGENRSSARGPKDMGRIWKGIYQSWLQSHSDVQSVKGRQWWQESFHTLSVSPWRALEHHQDGCCHVCTQGWYIRLVLPTQFPSPTRTPTQTEMNLTVSISLQVLQSQDLRVGQEKKPCIGFTQENSIESSVLDCLSYILNPYGHATTTLAYPK